MDLRAFDRVTDVAYLGDLKARPLAELRRLRAECQQVESDLSYLRRLVQGRLDIVTDAATRSEAGHPPADLAEVVAHLPEALGGHVVGPSSGRLTTTMGPASDATLTDELDAVCGPDALAALPSMDLAALVALRTGLDGYEHEVSTRRRLVFERLDALSGELARRYREGEASVDALLD